MINRRRFIGMGLAVAGSSLLGCAGTGSDGGWVTVLDGTSLAGWSQIGEGNWSIVEGTVQGKNGKLGYLVSAKSYADFEIRAEFWADADANSGIFMRCQDPKKIGSNSAYEANIFDKRSGQDYATGAIPNFGAVQQPAPKAANRWNTYEITARGDRLVVVLNGQQTVDVVNGKFRSGPIALQSAGGTIRFRKVQIREL